jgi:hypothetical protein
MVSKRLTETGFASLSGPMRKHRTRKSHAACAAPPPHRHCEEQSDEAIRLSARLRSARKWRRKSAALHAPAMFPASQRHPVI